jgi:hypothetical protein
LSSLETNIVSGAKFGSRFWGKPKIVDEVGNCKWGWIIGSVGAEMKRK